MSTYAVDSLEQIAVLFDGRAINAQQFCKVAATQRERLVFMREANTWRAAADLLRNTTLKEPQ